MSGYVNDAQFCIDNNPVERSIRPVSYTHLDVYKRQNMGCPFPLMTGKHKGSGILPYPAEVEALLKELVHYPELGFSLSLIHISCRPLSVSVRHPRILLLYGYRFGRH